MIISASYQHCWFNRDPGYSSVLGGKDLPGSLLISASLSSELKSKWGELDLKSDLGCGWISFYSCSVVWADSFIFRLDPDFRLTGGVGGLDWVWGVGGLDPERGISSLSPPRCGSRLSRGIRMKVHQTIGADNFIENTFWESNCFSSQCLEIFV